MWFDTLVLQLRLHMAYRVNGILYRLRFLSLSYESGSAKTLGLVLAVLRENSCIWRCFSPLPCC